jgi:hypothetical protein
VLSGRGVGPGRAYSDKSIASEINLQNKRKQAAPLSKQGRSSSVDSKIDDEDASVNVPEPSRRSGAGNKEITVGRNRRGWGAPVDPFKPQASAAPPRISPRVIESAVEMEEESIPVSGRDRGW